MFFHTIIIGAGISGLTAASQLQKSGLKVLLIESNNQVGGVIQSREVDGFLIERGPNSIRGSHEFLDLLEDHSLMDQLVTAAPKAPAYVYAGGKLQAVPMGLSALIKTKLISTRAKLRLLREPFIQARSDAEEESIASFIRRRLGPEILDRLVSPFVSGVYAGNVERLSIQASFPKLAELEAKSGSLFRGALRMTREAKSEGAKPKRSLRPYRMCSFRQGLNMLPAALAESLGENLLTSARVNRIRRLGVVPGASGFEVSVIHQGVNLTFQSSRIILATPASISGRLLTEVAPSLTALLAQIPYASLVSVPLGYRHYQLPRHLNGFGFLAPRSAGIRTLGSVWNSSLFSGRAPSGWVCLTNYIGGATDPGVLELTDKELINTVHEDLQKVLGVTGTPHCLPVTRWERALPQYDLGHAGLVAHIEAALQKNPGIFLAGNYLRGISLSDCIRQSLQVANTVAAYTPAPALAIA